jgi:septal ring factor EnvC (AmiA/AmiB activator)
MKTIKKYWAVIIGGILSFFAIIIAIFNKHKKKQVSKIEEKIDDNKSKIDQLQGKTDVIETQRTQVKEELDDLVDQIKQTKDAKKNIQSTTPKSVVDAKENILNKTKKRNKK